MDSLTQAVLGAAIQGSLLGRRQGRRGLVYGAALATLPDLDAIIQYADPVSAMTYHRGFSHSVFVLTGLAAVLTWLIRKRWPDAPYTGGRLFITLWLVLITHAILDSFTIYGTQLFWPLPLTPESWSAIFIIDPVYTLPLLAAVVFAAVKGVGSKSRVVMASALSFSSAYLAFGLWGRFHAEEQGRAALASDGVAVSELRAVPTPFNTLVWRIIAKTPDGFYYEAITRLLDRGAPERVRQPRGPALAKAIAGDPLHERLRWLTADWLRYDIVDRHLVVSDLRMGIPGQYTFRFAMARCDANDVLLPITPIRWENKIAGGDATMTILRRAFSPSPPIPLADWTRALNIQSASSCRSSS
ncbi:MAG: hydrolase [Stutzerimonas stutzeri]|nr:MAG: hydrolase [Stutzerimonas stutzeri]